MMKLSHYPFRNQFVVLMMTLASLMIAFYSIFTYFNEKEEYLSELGNEIKVISRVLENDYARLLMIGLPSESIELLNKWKQFPENTSKTENILKISKKDAFRQYDSSIFKDLNSEECSSASSLEAVSSFADMSFSPFTSFSKPLCLALFNFELRNSVARSNFFA